jgi:hypothetical protein
VLHIRPRAQNPEDLLHEGNAHHSPAA